jgi:hypothetical protein
VEILSTLSENNLQADARAFAALMRHVREVDKNHRVIMAQVENEVGLLGDSRDRSPAANEAFAKPVPKEFMDYLQKHKDTCCRNSARSGRPPASRPREPGRKSSGKACKTDEIFMGWNYARYVDKVAEAGKREYPIPMFANAWLNAPADKGPGDYPSGGPQAHMHDIWRAGAPQLDMLGPDIYMTNFRRAGGALQPVRQPAVHSRVRRRHPRSGQCVLRHRAAQRGRLFDDGRRRVAADDGLPGGRCPADGSRRCREPAAPAGLRHAHATRPAGAGAPGQGHHRRRVAQQGTRTRRSNWAATS